MNKIFCCLWNIGVILSIAWFIASIEFTIRWNDIRSVDTISTTGQLIPFIIGCVSASQVVKKLVLLAFAKVSCNLSAKHINRLSILIIMMSIVSLSSEILDQLMSMKKYPDWANVKLEMEGGINGPVIFNIVKKECGNSENNSQPGRAEILRSRTQSF